MLRRYYDLTTCTCAISAAAPVHEAMDHYLEPFRVFRVDCPDIELVVRGDADAVASVRASLSGVAADVLRRSHPDQRYQVWITDSEHEVLLPERTPDHVVTTTSNSLAVTADRERTAATIGVRIVRQLIMRGAEVCGGRAVHAGAVELNGEGVLVGGQPGAGKTSVLTRLVEDHGARSVANDRTVLVPSRDGSWIAAGVPLAWRFTPEGVNGSPRLAEGARRRHRARGRELVDGKVELTPREVSRILGRGAVGATEVKRVIVLVRLPGETPGAPDAAFLQRRLDFGAVDYFADDWLGIRHRLGARVLRSTNVPGWWANVAASVPVQVLTWTHPGELPRVAEAIAGVRR
jgi:hypothetical protein